MPTEYWKQARKPCRISDNIYYVGTESGPSHLIVTNSGLVLIDTSYAKTLYLLIENIRTLGFDPYDIKHIIHTHGHYDHIGGTRALVELTGAKTYIGRGDENMVNGRDGTHLGGKLEEPFEADVIIEDGDVISFGDTIIRFVSTPGHTEGTISLFFDTTYKGKTYLAGMFGGAGLNSLTKEFLAKYNLPLEMRDKFLSSIDKIYNEPVTLHLGNHLSNNNHRDKQERLTDTYNPFVEENTYKSFLEGLKSKAIVEFSK
ncbi:MAG: MBL fold metallo-hydrolase [Ruminococcaceae bacterium]|nr:MBL fold metallo-hydrolase [Oscillospiraceae bacterium]